MIKTPPSHHVRYGRGVLTRAVVFTLHPSPAQERLAHCYAGARRFAYNWAIGTVSQNLAARSGERAAGIAETDVTPAVSWSAYSLGKAFNVTKGEIAPWWREVSMHAFRSGITDAATALANFSESKRGAEQARGSGSKVQGANRSTPSVSFVEINHQLSWLHPTGTTSGSCCAVAV